MPQIFISHAEEDQRIALQVAGELEETGYSTWYYERDSVPGSDYLDQVCKSIKQCEAFLLVISGYSMASHQVNAEVVVAFETRKPFVPLLHRLTHAQFQQRKDSWRLATAASTSVEIPQAGVREVAERLRSGIRELGLRPSVRRQPAHKTDDGIECSVFAPPRVLAGEQVLVHAWLHTPEQEDDISRSSSSFDPQVRLRSRLTLATDLTPGTKLSLGLKAGSLSVRSLANDITWQGGPHPGPAHQNLAVSRGFAIG